MSTNTALISKTEVTIKAREIIGEQLGIKDEDLPKKVTLDTMLKNLGADSLDIVELEMKLGDQYGLEFGIGQEIKISTLRDAVNYITERLKYRKNI